MVLKRLLEGENPLVPLFLWGPPKGIWNLGNAAEGQGQVALDQEDLRDDVTFDMTHVAHYHCSLLTERRQLCELTIWGKRIPRPKSECPPFTQQCPSAFSFPDFRFCEP